VSKPKDRKPFTENNTDIGVVRRVFQHIRDLLTWTDGSRGSRQALLSVAALVLATILVVGPALARLPRGPRAGSDTAETASVGVARSGTLRWALGEGSEIGRLACAARGLPRFEVALLWTGQLDRTSAPQGDAVSHDAAQTLGRTLALADTLQGRLEHCGAVESPDPQVAPTKDGDIPEVGVTPTLNVANVVHFAFDRADVEGHSVAVLDSVAAAILQVPGVLVELVGHTDVRGPSEYNAVLGERRADAVRRYLQGRGVAAERIQARSRGEDDTYRPNARTNRDHALNRRVEIRFVTPGSSPIQVHRQDRDLKFKPSRRSLPSELAPGAASPRPPVVSPKQTAAGGYVHSASTSASLGAHLTATNALSSCHELRVPVRSLSQACLVPGLAHPEASSPSWSGPEAFARGIHTQADPISRSRIEHPHTPVIERHPRKIILVSGRGLGTRELSSWSREVELRFVRSSSGLSKSA
jgi:outer membrane protein OmpA-like peptidoglycan-associated protein